MASVLELLRWNVLWVEVRDGYETVKPVTETRRL